LLSLVNGMAVPLQLRLCCIDYTDLKDYKMEKFSE